MLRFVAGEECHQICHVFRSAEALQYGFSFGNFLRFIRHLLHHVGHYQTGCYCVARDSLVAEFFGDGFGQTDDPGFSGGVISLSEFTAHTVDGSQIDDSAVTLLAEKRSDCPDIVKVSL